MALRIQNTKHLRWEEDNTVSVNYYELIADSVSDIPTDPYIFSTDTDRYKIAMGSLIYVILTSEMYMYLSSGNWVKQSGSSGGGGFIPTDEQLAAMNSGITAEKLTTMESDIDGKQDTLSSEQLDAVNSGITSEDVAQIGENKNNILTEQAKTAGMTEGGSNYITVGGIRVYVSATAPTGTIPDGSIWIGG